MKTTDWVPHSRPADLLAIPDVHKDVGYEAYGEPVADEGKALATYSTPIVRKRKISWSTVRRKGVLAFVKAADKEVANALVLLNRHSEVTP